MCHDTNIAHLNKRRKRILRISHAIFIEFWSKINTKTRIDELNSHINISLAFICSSAVQQFRHKTLREEWAKMSKWCLYLVRDRWNDTKCDWWWCGCCTRAPYVTIYWPNVSIASRRLPVSSLLIFFNKNFVRCVCEFEYTQRLFERSLFSNYLLRYSASMVKCCSCMPLWAAFSVTFLSTAAIDCAKKFIWLCLCTFKHDEDKLHFDIRIFDVFSTNEKSKNICILLLVHDGYGNVQIE